MTKTMEQPSSVAGFGVRPATWRQVAAEIGVLDEDVDAFCELVPGMGFAKDGLTEDEESEFDGYCANGGRYSNSPLEEGTLIVRLEHAATVPEVAHILRRLDSLPNARWRGCLVPDSILQALSRAAAKVRG